MLTQAAYEEEETKVITPVANEKSNLDTSSVSAAGPSLIEEEIRNSLDLKETAEASSSCKQSHEQSVSSESETEVIGTSTALHEASQSGNSQKVLELLEQGLDPCIKDERGRTPYMLATEKEVRNTFRRFMASNLDRWDWLAAKVPSALTKEMEESQAAKQVVLILSSFSNWFLSDLVGKMFCVLIYYCRDNLYSYHRSLKLRCLLALILWSMNVLFSCIDNLKTCSLLMLTSFFLAYAEPHYVYKLVLRMSCQEITFTI